MRIPGSVPSILMALCSATVVAAATPGAPDARDASIPRAVAAAPAMYIVQAATLNAARGRVSGVGGHVGHDLEIIHAVSAELTLEQASRLRADSKVRIFEDRVLSTRGSLLGVLKSTTNSTNNIVASSVVGSVTAGVAAPVVASVTAIKLVNSVTSPVVKSLSASSVLKDGTGVSALTLTYETNYPQLIGADSLQRAGINGKGVTIAVLDTGLWQDVSQNYGSRLLASYDVVKGGGAVTSDPYGHGTHVTSIAASGAQALSGGYLGIAPKANLVVVRAFNGEGAGRYVDVIEGVNWIVANKKKYNIRVLNLSFGAAPQSYYWDDPLNQAVMAAWKAGIVVVAASGNEGPDPMTIDVPGNVPYVITVGALTDSGTPYDATDDKLASFSSTGPTLEGFVKPELVAPGGHIAASMSSSSYLANLDPDSMKLGQQMFTMSGTSQAAAVTTGVVALMLQDDPSLTPDAVKCRLLVSARPAVKANGKLAYSVFQQGAGLINAVAAVNSSAINCANGGLDIDDDLAGIAHFGGPANQDANGNYYVMDMTGSTWGDPLGSDGYTWSRSYPWDQGYAWSDGYTWSKGYTWSRGYTWSKGYTWSRGYTWSKGYTWSRTLPWWNAPPTSTPAAKPASITSWVPNE